MSDLDEFFGPRPEPEPQSESQSEPTKSYSPRDYSRTAEDWQRQRLNRALSTRFTKNTDAPQELPDGTLIRVVNHVDYTGDATLTLPGREPYPYRVQVEVKCFAGNFQWGTVNKAQARILDVARLSGQLPLIGICEHEVGSPSVTQGWIVPWRRPVDQYPLHSRELALLAKLAARLGYELKPGWTWGKEARQFLCDQSELWIELGVSDWADCVRSLLSRATGGFKGKSFRPQDQDLLAEHRYRKIKGAWELPNWLAQLTTQAVMIEQPLPF